MDKDLFNLELLRMAWMKSRYFNFKDFKEFHLHTERDFYDDNIEFILEDIRLKLKDGYKFHPKYIVPFPKKNGLIRRRAFINLQDQIVTHALLEIIGYKIDRKFYRYSFAHRLDMKKSPYSANTFIYYYEQYNKFLKYLMYQLKKGYIWYCETDITSYFDHVRHDLLTAQLNDLIKGDHLEYIRDGLIPNFLGTPNIQNNKLLSSKAVGIPQGGAFSSFLSNVYLTEIDYKMGRIPNIKYMRYVDDMRILGKNPVEVEKALLYLQSLLFDLGLELNSSKTLIKKVEKEVDIEKFKREQAEKLSQFNEPMIGKKEIQELSDIKELNEELLSKENDNFDEILKLRERKKNFVINKFITRGVPKSFSYLKDSVEERLDKATYLLTHLYQFKHKVRGVEELNEKFINRPYDVIQGVALKNKIRWSRDFRDVAHALPTDSGMVELALINNGDIYDPLLFSKVLREVYTNIKSVNPFLIQVILYQFQNQSYLHKLKINFISQILKSKKYKESDVSIHIADIFMKEKEVFDTVKEQMEKEVKEFILYLRDYSFSYYNILCSLSLVESKVQPTVEEGYLILSEFLDNRIFSHREVNIIMQKIINLLVKSPVYMGNPSTINAWNIWIKKGRQYGSFEVKLSPSPVEKTLFRTPEEILNTKDIDIELQVSFLIGLLWIGLYMESTGHLLKYYQPYAQFDPKKLWGNNEDLFRYMYKKNILEGTEDYEDFMKTLKNIGELTRKNPIQRKKIKELLEEENEVSDTGAIDVFYSYSHEDELFRNQLLKHLTLMKRSGVINGWSDRDINAGDEWKESIHDRLESAKVILLLISADFLASDYCYDIEMMRALERHESGDAKVIPIILRSCDWEGAPFSKLQALPPEARPLDLWENQDEAFTKIVEGIKRSIQSLRKK